MQTQIDILKQRLLTCKPYETEQIKLCIKILENENKGKAEQRKIKTTKKNK